MPGVRRLVLQALQIGIHSVHIVGRVGPIADALSDLIPSESFHMVNTLEELQGFHRIVDLGETERVLVLRPNHVIDRWSLERFLHASGGDGGYSLTDDGATAIGGIFVVGGGELLPLLAALWSPDSSDR